MKYKLCICAVVLFAVSLAHSQVASHQPESQQPQPKFEVPSAYLTPAGKPVARVNGVVLTDVDLVREEYAIFPYAAQHGGKIPASFEPGIRKGALEMIIFEELVYQDARKRGVTIPAERMNKAEAEFRKQFKSPSEFQQFLKTEFQGNEQTLRDKIKRSLLIEQLLKTEVEARSTVSLAEVKGLLRQEPGPLRLSGIVCHSDHFDHSARQSDSRAVEGSEEARG